MVHEGGWTLTCDPATGTWTADRSPPWYPPERSQSTSPRDCLTRSSPKRAS
jgi:hypothetical protein